MFRATSPSERGELKSKGGGRKTIHYNGSGENIELILRTMCSVDQLSFCGAVARIPTLKPHLGAQHHQHRVTCCKFVSRNSQNVMKINNCRNFAKMLVSSGRDRTDLHHNWWRRGNYADSISRIHTTSICENIQTKGVDSFKHMNWSRIGSKDVIVLLSCLNRCLEIERFHRFGLWLVSTNTSQKRQ